MQVECSNPGQNNRSTGKNRKISLKEEQKDSILRCQTGSFSESSMKKLDSGMIKSKVDGPWKLN